MSCTGSLCHLRILTYSGINIVLISNNEQVSFRYLTPPQHLVFKYSKQWLAELMSVLPLIFSIGPALSRFQNITYNQVINFSPLTQVKTFFAKFPSSDGLTPSILWQILASHKWRNGLDVGDKKLEWICKRFPGGWTDPIPNLAPSVTWSMPT